MRTVGQRHLYALRPEPFRELEAWLARYRGLWGARLESFWSCVRDEPAASLGGIPPRFPINQQLTLAAA